MITAEDILSFNYYTYKNAFTGSDNGMRYKIVLKQKELPLPADAKEGDKAPVEKVFLASKWPEPFAYDKADKETIQEKEFTFDQDGYKMVIDYLNQGL